MVDKIITYFLLLLGIVTNAFGRKSRLAIGKFTGRAMMAIGPDRKKVTRGNLARAFPEKSLNEIKRICRESYENLGITLLELLKLRDLSETELREIVRYENIELINDVHSRGKGLILLSGHFGNWEYLAYTAGLFSGIPVTVIVKPQKNKTSDILLNSYRIKGGNRIVNMYKAAREIISVLGRGEAIALLADQSATKDKDVFVDFFGIPAATYEAPARLSLKFKSPIIMGFAVRQNDGTYRVKLEEINPEDFMDDDDPVIALTSAHVKALENAIRENPGQWAWQHKRWKHTFE